MGDMYRYGYPIQPATTTNCTPISNSGQSPFLRRFDDLSLLENDMDVHSQAGTSTVDPGLVMLLEFSRELYSRRSELFEKLFPGLHDDFVELLKRIDAILLQGGKLNNFSQTHLRTLQRSLSVGSPRTPASTGGGEEDFRLMRFKVRTMGVGGDEPGDRGGGSGGVQSDTKKGSGAN